MFIGKKSIILKFIRDNCKFFFYKPIPRLDINQSDKLLKRKQKRYLRVKII